MTFEMPADDLTVMISNDGRFASDVAREHAYRLWFGQWTMAPERRSFRGSDERDAASWVAASAAGCVGEAMSVLCAPSSARFRICAGCLDTETGWNMYYFVERGWPQPVRPVDSAKFATGLEDAVAGRRLVEQHFFDQWMRDGGIAGLKYWSIPFLEVVP